MLTYYTGMDDSGELPSSSSVDLTHLVLSRQEIQKTKDAALRTVRVPPAVIQMVTDLRTFLQEKIEPPMYVSDRRLVKSLQLLQVRVRACVRACVCVCGVCARARVCVCVCACV